MFGTTGPFAKLWKAVQGRGRSLGVDPLTRKRKLATTTVKGTRKDAERELRRLLRTIDTGDHIDPTRMTVGGWLAQWHESKREEVSPKTHERYGEIVDNFLIPALGALPLAKLAPSNIDKAYSEWAIGGRRDGKAAGLSSLTGRYIRIVLKSALSRAIEQQLIVRNPAEIFSKRLPKVERKEMVTFVPEQSVEFLEILKIVAPIGRYSWHWQQICGVVKFSLCVGRTLISIGGSCAWRRV